jgi:uncharacterized lipoprotein NlpE involved in copper resistance
MSEDITNSTSSMKGPIGIALVALGLAGTLGYSYHERNVAQQLTTQNQEMTASLNDTRGKVDALNTKLEAMSAEQAAARQAAQPAVVSPSAHRQITRQASQRRRMDDARWKQVQDQLAEHGKQIDATKQDLVSARTELSGSIARTHDELVLLEKKGERSYYEFDVNKTGQFHRTGPVSVRLKKANSKRQYADLELMIDDFKLSKKHVNLFEPAFFYATENGRPVEMVINNISKDHIHGYVSEPRYKNGDLEAMAGTSQAGAAATPAGPPPRTGSTVSSTPPERRKLELPPPK